MKCEMKIFQENGSWYIMAEPGTERGIDGSILWEGKQYPTVQERRAIYNAVSYGVRLAVRGASIYVDSAIKGPTPPEAESSTPRGLPEGSPSPSPAESAGEVPVDLEGVRLPLNYAINTAVYCRDEVNRGESWYRQHFGILAKQVQEADAAFTKCRDALSSLRGEALRGGKGGGA